MTDIDLVLVKNLNVLNDMRCGFLNAKVFRFWLFRCFFSLASTRDLPFIIRADSLVSKWLAELDKWLS